MNRPTNQQLLNKAREENSPLHETDTGHESLDTMAEDDRKLDRDEAPFEWRRPSTLDAPDPMPGFVQRWVKYNDTPDGKRNWLNAMSEGWRPRKLSSVPDGTLIQSTKHETFGDVIGVPGLILCQMRKSVAAQRDKYYHDAFNIQGETIEELKEKALRDGVKLLGGHKRTVSAGRTAGHS